jgi:hypothetical protein
MPHHIRKCTNSLYYYVKIDYYTNVSLMYKLKKIENLFTNKFVGTGPLSYEKRIYRAAVLQMLRNTAVDNKEIRYM